MSARVSRNRTATALRILFALLIVALLGAVLLFIIRRADRPPVVRPETKPLTQQKVNIAEDIALTKDPGGRNILSIIKASRAAGADGLDHYTGIEGAPFKIEVRTRDGSLRFSVTAAEAVSDAEMSHVSFQGGAVVAFEGVTITGQAFEFDQKNNIVTTSNPVRFEGEKFRGECPRAFYDLGAEKLLFSGGVSLLVMAWSNDPVPLVFTGEEMSYDKPSRTGQIRGDVRMTHGRSRGRADTVDFAQFTDKPGFRLFEFTGGVTIDADERPESRPVPARSDVSVTGPVVFKDEELILFQGGRQHMEAGVVTMLPYPGEEWLHVVSLKGGGRLEIFSDDGRQTTFEAGELEFFYGPDGALRDFNLRREVRILGEAEKQIRLVEAPKIDYNANQGDLVVDGLGGLASTISSGREAKAEKMFLNLKSNDFRMVGDVRIVNHPQPGEKRGAGLFAPDDSVFMIGDEATYEAEGSVFRLSGENARLWQDRDSLEAREVEMNEETGDLTAKHGVRSVFFHRPKGKERDERIEVKGERLDRLAKTNRVFYEQSCSLSVEGIVLRSGRLILEPDEEAGKFKRIYADGGRVTILQGERRAEGDQADYDLAEDVIVLTGRTVLEDKEKVFVQGRKLTFHPADGKIIVENQDASERSVTIIKS
jgi:lipopolysaccharide export system protein LptA